jgi:FkbM family methyltransferase
MSNTTELTVGGVSAEFITRTRKEYSRFDNLMGEAEVLEDLLSEIEGGDTFYDIGANVGMYSCFVGKNDSETTVVAFEPHPANARRFDQNVELNDIHAKLRTIALSDTNGWTDLRISESGETGVGSHSLSTGDSDRTVEVEVRRGEEIATEESAPTVLKIDVEGAEFKVIKGLEGCLDSCRLIYCEVHPGKMRDFETTPEELETFLRGQGYTIHRPVDFSGAGYMLKCTYE